MSFFLCPLVLLPLSSCPSLSFLLLCLSFFLCPPILLSAEFRIPTRVAAGFLKGFLQAFYRVPTGFSCVYQVAPHTRFKHISQWRTNHHMKFHTQWHMNMSVSWLRWQHMLPSTRLETRTKDSNICASSWVSKLRTRKMVNYAWEQWIQGKLWWRLVAVLTRKSSVILEYRGARLVEPSSSWFLPKFPAG